jgi:hypothetical protein
MYVSDAEYVGFIDYDRAEKVRNERHAELSRMGIHDLPAGLNSKYQSGDAYLVSPDSAHYNELLERHENLS